MKDREDYVFILHFLETASERIPELISLWMKDQWSSVP